MTYQKQLKQMTNEELIEILSQDSPFKLTIIKAEVLSRMEPYRLARAGGHDIAEYYEENEDAKSFRGLLTRAKAITEHLTQLERNEYFDMEIEAIKTKDNEKNKKI